MHRYFKKIANESSSLPSSSKSENSPLNEEGGNNLTQPQSPSCGVNTHFISSSTQRSRVDANALPSDPGERKPMSQYYPDERDEVRRAYLQKGPFQPRNHAFPQTLMSGNMRRFNDAWFGEYGNWLEYSIKEDAAFCLCCYLFKNDETSHFGGDAFTSKGFRSWNKVDRFKKHIGGVNSMHNQCVKRCEDLMMQRQSIQTALDKQSEHAKAEYRTRLTASVDVSRLLLFEGLPFRGHDESEHSKRKGVFRSILKFHGEKNENVGSVILKNAPGNCIMYSPDIQKDIANACSKETVNAILEEIGDGYFAVLADESRDVSCKQQMAIVLRYVDKMGFVMERLVSLVHVTSTTALSLKEEIYSVLAKLSLSPSRIRGQGYDGASNMRGHINGLRTLILQENPSAHYVHCFAHQLQLTLVGVANGHPHIKGFLELVNLILNVIGGSYKRRDEYRTRQSEKVEEALRVGELVTGKGLNQELGLQRPSNTRWGSHFKTFVNLIVMFAPIVDVLDALATDRDSDDNARGQAILDGIQTYDFAFVLHLMKLVLGITNALSQALQRRDQDIVNALSLLGTAKKQLQRTRDHGWDALIDDVKAFCLKHDIEIPNMEDFAPLRARGKSKRRLSSMTNEHYYRVDVFYSILDMQMQELNSRFTEASTDLLLGLSCLSPADSFASFDKDKILRMARLYPDDFDEFGIEALGFELDTYIDNMRDDERFSNLNGLGELSTRMIKSKKHLSFPRMHLLLKLALILPVSTATVERVFSSMKYIKTNLRNRISDEFLNDTVITYFEDDLFESVSTDDILHRFQNMRCRRGQLD